MTTATTRPTMPHKLAKLLTGRHGWSARWADAFSAVWLAGDYTLSVSEAAGPGDDAILRCLPRRRTLVGD